MVYHTQTLVLIPNYRSLSSQIVGTYSNPANTANPNLVRIILVTSNPSVIIPDEFKK